MPDDSYRDPSKEDIVYGDRRISRPDASLPDWEVPDTAYRPIPIVWFTGALIFELIALSLIALIVSSQNGWITISLSAMTTIAIGVWTWARGMKDAGAGWKIATALMLATQFGFAALAASARI